MSQSHLEAELSAINTRHLDGVRTFNQERLNEVDSTLNKTKRRSDSSSAFAEFFNKLGKAAVQVDLEELKSLKLYKPQSPCSPKPMDHWRTQNEWTDHSMSMKEMPVLSDESQLETDGQGTAVTEQNIGAIELQLREVEGSNSYVLNYGGIIEVDSHVDADTEDRSLEQLLAAQRQPRKLLKKYRLAGGRKTNRLRVHKLDEKQE